MTTTFDKIASSDIFLVIGTANYLKEVFSPGPLTEQIKIAKSLKKPVLLMVDISLNEEQKCQLRELFSEFDRVREIEFDKDDMVTLDKKLAAALKELVIRQGK